MFLSGFNSKPEVGDSAAACRPRGSALSSPRCRLWVLVLPCLISSPSSAFDPTCWLGSFEGLQDACCDRSHGANGLESCWADGFTFQRCCGTDSNPNVTCFKFDTCCASGSPCKVFSMCCDLSKPNTYCGVDNSLDCTTRNYGPQKYMLKNWYGHPAGYDFGLAGKLYHNGPLKLDYESLHEGRLPIGLLKEQGNCLEAFNADLRFGRLLPEGIGNQERYRCWNSDPQCAVYALRLAATELPEVALNHYGEGIRKHRMYTVTLPVQCTSAQIAIVLIPKMLERHYDGPAQVNEIRIKRVLFEDPCMWSARPILGMPSFVSMALLVPWLACGQTCALNLPTGTLGGTDVLRVIGLWYIFNEHTLSYFPFRMLVALGGHPPEEDGHRPVQTASSTFMAIYSVLTVRMLSLSRRTLCALSARLCRKMIRQTVAALALLIWLPHSLFVPAPHVCLKDMGSSHWTSDKVYSYMTPWKQFYWFLKLVTMTMQKDQWIDPNKDDWPTVVWFFAHELRMFMLVALLSLSVASFPTAAGVSSVALLAWALSIVLFRIPSVWGLDWLAMVSMLFCVNEFLEAKAMPLWSSSRSHFRLLGSIALLTYMCVHFVIMMRQPTNAVVHALWNVVLLFASHLRGRLPASWETLVRFLSTISLSLNMTHRLAIMSVAAQFPFVLRFTQESSGLEKFLFYHIPMVLLSVLVAVFVQVVFVQPWMLVAKQLEKLPTFVCGLALGYVVLCCEIWRRESAISW